MHHGHFSRYKVGVGDVVVSQFQFANDTLLIGDMFLRNALTMKAILRWFELVSGLKVNFIRAR